MAGHGEGWVKAILYALAANGCIAVAKGVAALWSGSGAMLADVPFPAINTSHLAWDDSNRRDISTAAQPSARAGYLPYMHFDRYSSWHLV